VTVCGLPLAVCGLRFPVSGCGGGTDGTYGTNETHGRIVLPVLDDVVAEQATANRKLPTANCEPLAQQPAGGLDRD
jgi:hypothetical protein